MDPSREIALRRSLRGRCPRCNGATLFKSSFRLHERCPSCGLPLELEDGWSYGAVPLNYALACLAWVLPIGLCALVGLVPVRLAVMVALGGVIVIPILTFRFTKALWVGLYYTLVPREMRKRDLSDKGDIH